jgi:hypothetical protein
MNPLTRATPRATLAFTLCCLAAGVTAAPLQVRLLTMKPPAGARDLDAYAAGWADGAIKMPFVVSDDAAVAVRINGSLFIGLLGMAPPPKPGASFTPLADQLPAGTAEQTFRVTRNDDRVLALAVSGEGCGAYCENYDTDLNFDARNGRALALADLFNPAALNTLAQRIDKERARRYAAQLQTLKKELATQRKAHAKADELDDTEMRIALNQDCLAGVKTSPSRTDNLGYTGFSLAGPGIALRTGRCSNHASRALDDVGAIVTPLAPDELRPLLTPYGRALVLNDGDAPPPAAVFGQILRGRIGGAAVTLLLDRPAGDGAVSGHYFYDRYGRLIALAGTRQGNVLTLIEGEGATQAELTLTVRGDTVTGQWKGNGKTLPVALEW